MDYLLLAIYRVLLDGQPLTIKEIINAIERSDYYEEYDNTLIDYHKVYKKLKHKEIFSILPTHPRKYYIK